MTAIDSYNFESDSVNVHRVDSRAAISDAIRQIVENHEHLSFCILDQTYEKRD